MPEPRQTQRLIIIAKQSEFHEERWKNLLTTLAYLLHEQRKAQATAHSDDKADSKGK